MANKFDGDVRPLSNDQRYMGAPFMGLIDDAIQQAHDAPDHGLAEQAIHPSRISRDRWNLLEHLNLADHYDIDRIIERHRARMIEMAADRISREADETPRYEDRNFIVPAGSNRVVSKYSLEYAIAQGWVVRVQD